MSFILWVDSDSVPLKHREIILRRAMKNNIKTNFVADRTLKDVTEAISEHSKQLRDPYRETLSKEELRNIKSSINMIVVESGSNAADDYIVEHAKAGQLCITHDIPLAARLVDKDVNVIDDRGNSFSKDNIKERLSIRNSMYIIREMGACPEKQKHFDLKTLEKFSNSFDRALQFSNL